MCDRILQADPSYNDAQYQLACIRGRRADLHAKSPTKLGDADQCYSAGAALLETLARSFKLIPHYRQELAETLSGRAEVRLALGRLAEAQRDCDDSRGMIAALMDDASAKIRQKTRST